MNRIEIAGNIGLLYLQDGDVVLLDAADVNRVASVGGWTKNNHGYAFHSYRESGSRQTKSLLLHRFILEAPSGVLVDHEGFDTLDCRKSKIRLATKLENNRYRHGWKSKVKVKGVFWEERTQKWRAGIGLGSKKYWLGRFASAEQASVAYDEAASRLFGEFAQLNAL